MTSVVGGSEGDNTAGPLARKMVKQVPYNQAAQAVADEMDGPRLNPFQHTI